MRHYTVRTQNTSFGKNFKLPRRVDKFPVVIICVNNGYGLRPVDLCLPHQVYKEKIQRLLQEYPDTTTITLIPANNEDYFDLWKR